MPSRIPSDRRIHPAVERAPGFEILVDGEPLLAHPGESVAAVLFAAGRLRTHRSARLDQPRGFYCGMGVCWECAVSVDGRPGFRACVTAARPGMRVETGRGGHG